MSNNAYHIKWSTNHNVPNEKEVRQEIADKLEIPVDAVDISRVGTVGQPPKDEIGIQTRTMPRMHIKEKIEEVVESHKKR